MGVVSAVAVPVEALGVGEVPEHLVAGGEAPGDGVVVAGAIVVEARGVHALAGVPVLLGAGLAAAGAVRLVVRLIDDASGAVRLEAGAA